MKYPHIQQHDEKDCGAACLSMISKYYGLKMPLGKLRELIKVDSNGANIYGIVDGAKKLGFDCDALKGYDIEMLPNKIEGNGYGVLESSSPDYLIDGKAFDCYSPNVSNVRNVWSVVTLKTETQATRIVLNLDGYTGGTIDEIASQFLEWDIPSLEELLLIKDGKIIRLIIK